MSEVRCPNCTEEMEPTRNYARFDCPECDHWATLAEARRLEA